MKFLKNLFRKKKPPANTTVRDQDGTVRSMKSYGDYYKKLKGM